MYTQPRLLTGRSADDWPRDARGAASGLAQNIHAEDAVAPEARLVMRKVLADDDISVDMHVVPEAVGLAVRGVEVHRARVFALDRALPLAHRIAPVIRLLRHQHPINRAQSAQSSLCMLTPGAQF